MTKMHIPTLARISDSTPIVPDELPKMRVYCPTCHKRHVVIAHLHWITINRGGKDELMFFCDIPECETRCVLESPSD
jgi:hypothetical protein